MFKQGMKTRHGMRGEVETGKLDSIKRMLSGIDVHSAADEHYALGKETGAFQAHMTEVERSRALAFQYMRFETIR